MISCDFKFLPLLGLSLLVLIDGCDQSATRSAATEVEKTIVRELKIHWFDGSVEEGFALAKSENKPVYLYWGAVWCPPCQYLKTTIFSRPEFVEKSNEFVTVYLDGDTERAQIYGERFDVMGYPTVIIFSPEGEEIMRMPTDVEPARVDYVTAIAPLLEDRCGECHGAGSPTPLSPDDAYATLVSHVDLTGLRARRSPLVERLLGEELDAPGTPSRRCPPDADPALVRTFVRWIESGAFEDLDRRAP